jgi:hypothetical protein
MRTLISQLLEITQIKKPAVIKREVSVYYHPDGEEWWILWPDGAAEVSLDPVDVLKRVKKSDTKIGTKEKAAVVTVLSWENVPKGFKAPG